MELDVFEDEVLFGSGLDEEPGDATRGSRGTRGLSDAVFDDSGEVPAVAFEEVGLAGEVFKVKKFFVQKVESGVGSSNWRGQRPSRRKRRGSGSHSE